MKAECIYSPACRPAASGRGITLAMMNKRGLIQKQALAHPVTHSPREQGSPRCRGGILPRALFCFQPSDFFFFLTTSLRGVCCAVRIEKKVYRLGNRFECEAGFVEGGGPVRLAEVWIQRRVYFNEKRRCDVLVSVWESVIRSARRG